MTELTANQALRLHHVLVGFNRLRREHGYEFVTAIIDIDGAMFNVSFVDEAIGFKAWTSE